MKMQQYPSVFKAKFQQRLEKLRAPGAFELLEKLLCMDPKRRISATDALQVGRGKV